MGRQLYTRLNTMAAHYNKIDQNPDRAADAYNATLNSIDTRVMVTTRKLSELDVVSPTAPRVVDTKSATTKTRHAVAPDPGPEP